MREIAAHLAVSAYLEDWHSYAIARPPRHPSWEAHQGLARPSLTLGPYARAREATPKGRGARGGRRPGSQIPPPLFNLQSPSATLLQPSNSDHEVPSSECSILSHHFCILHQESSHQAQHTFTSHITLVGPQAQHTSSIFRSLYHQYSRHYPQPPFLHSTS